MAGVELGRNQPPAGQSETVEAALEPLAEPDPVQEQEIDDAPATGEEAGAGGAQRVEAADSTEVCPILLQSVRAGSTSMCHERLATTGLCWTRPNQLRQACCQQFQLAACVHCCLAHAKAFANLWPPIFWSMLSQVHERSNWYSGGIIICKPDAPVRAPLAQMKALSRT